MHVNRETYKMLVGNALVNSSSVHAPPLGEGFFCHIVRLRELGR